MLYYTERVTIVTLISFLSFQIPSIDIDLSIGGAVLGLAVNIAMPVLFYNRAYSGDPKNLLKDRGAFNIYK